MTLGVKPYPSCRYSHAAIDGILNILEENNLDTNSDIKIDKNQLQKLVTFYKKD